MRTLTPPDHRSTDLMITARAPLEEIVSARRERILDAARGVIVREGYVGVSMHAIARAAGVTRPALYAEFGDRDEVFAALLDREKARVVAMAASAQPTIPPDADPADMMVDLVVDAVDVFLDLAQSAPETWQLVVMSGDGLPAAAHDRIDHGRNEIRQQTEAAITAVAALHDRVIDAELLSHAITSAGETGVRLALADGGARRDAVSRTLRWMIRRMTEAMLAVEAG
ncbi:helix-turn-helix domain-containing protein [Nocardia sp. NPDC046473]|uniref:TetR/AcrR family transcriptional regulator n=1 Tax=Nocardia sp. NPDC046473 TaxID=3155733 RepID=UPI0033FE7714